MLAASWIDATGKRVDHQYLVPNANQCKGCHRVEDDKFEPIGPKARYLNKDFAYAEGAENQLAHWSRVGILDGAPPPETCRAFRCGTTRRAAASRTARAPTSRSTARTATRPADRRAPPGST